MEGEGIKVKSYWSGCEAAVDCLTTSGEVRGIAINMATIEMGEKEGGVNEPERTIGAGSRLGGICLAVCERRSADRVGEECDGDDDGSVEV